MRKQTKNILKWTVYIVTLLVLFILQTTPGLFQIFGTRPILVLPFAVCLSMFETEKTAAVLGALAGGLWDISSGKLLGFSLILIMLCCVFCSLLVMYLAKLNIVNALFLCAATIVIYMLFNFVFYYAMWGFDNLSAVVLHKLLPVSVYTLAVTPIIYFLTRKIYFWFHDPADE